MTQNLSQFTNSHTLSDPEVTLQKTYGLLSLSFIPCAAGALLGMVFNPFTMLGGGWAGVIVMMVFFYGMCFAIEKNRYNKTGVTLLMVFTFGMGLMLSPLLQYSANFSNGGGLVATAALMTAGIFFSMTTLARRLNFNTNALGRSLSMGVIVLMIGVVANLFFNIPALSLALSAVFVIISSLIIMWQVRTVIEGGETSHISAALTIFISIYNIFSSLLRLLIAFAGSDD